mmetsp:Transcript_22806/g.70266  ORF Transcript_22806/g.70266 Transcript_22806/m.70266 type:complete len:84 (-) Transcript_22806:344-595(-)
MQYNIHADLKAKRSKCLLSRRRRGDDRRKQLRGNVNATSGNAHPAASRRRRLLVRPWQTQDRDVLSSSVDPESAAARARSSGN